MAQNVVKQSFLGNKATEKRYKRSEMIQRGVSVDQMKRGKVGYGNRRTNKTIYTLDQMIAVGMLDRYGGMEIDASEGHIGGIFQEFPKGGDNSGEIGNVVRASYDHKFGVVHYMTKTGEKNVIIVEEDNMSKGRGKQKHTPDRGIIFDIPIVILKKRGSETPARSAVFSEPELKEEVWGEEIKRNAYENVMPVINKEEDDE